MVNLYSILGVCPQAGADEIKAAYRRCARDSHPDHNPGDAARFRNVADAYAVLSHPQRRASYDAERRDWIRGMGALECSGCGSANRITRRPAANEQVRCWSCKTVLPLTLPEVLLAQRQSLVNETARVASEVGGELAELAIEAVRTGLGSLRRRVGLAPRERFGNAKR